tara:strand:+ start:4338 stop:6059 length:1722 start_codon:yes stop_codon:yes gene_type:complete
MPKLSTLIDRHKQFYERNEKKQFDKARRYYRGDFWFHKSVDIQNSNNLHLCSKNLIYAIADTAVSALLGPNPRVAAMPQNQRSQEAVPAVTGLLQYVFRDNRMRRRAATALIDAVLCKRGIFKTSWNSAKDAPTIKVVDPSSLFFDLTVRDVADIKYWLEATVVPFAEFKARVESGQYKAKMEDVQPDRYPTWILGDDQKGQADSVRDAFQWVTVWEHYDRENNTVKHYVRQLDQVVFEDTIEYIPYSMFSLNQSGVDCLGLSEVQLVLNQQETVNDLLTHMKRITYLQVPRILYDAGRISEEDLNKAVEASVGSFVGMSPQNSESLRTIASLFYEMPMPQTPQGVVAFIDRQEGDAAFISALAEAARGQVVGARTATEMAIIDAQMKNRLATREGHLNDALEDVAAKAYYLCRKYMRGEKMIRIAGNRKWAAVTLDTIQDVDVEFEMVSYNPIKTNPAVMIETLLQLIPLLQQDPNIDARQLSEELIKGLGMPTSLLMPEEDVAEAAQMQMEQQQQMALGGAAAGGGGPPMGAEGPVSPEEIALLEAAMGGGGAAPEESLAAGGGSPIRGEA